MAKYSLSWDAYRNSICSGFSSLQQNGEFVDMTLAADGHFVKVHQVIMALVSPYLKELITSAPCQHPVIYLNNVSSETLTSLLEFVYTGEAVISTENFKSFIETAKNLHIRGLEEFDHDSDNNTKRYSTQNEDDVQLCHLTGTKRTAVEPVGSAIEASMSENAQDIVIKEEEKNMESESRKRRKPSPPNSFLDVSGDVKDADDNFTNDESFNDSQLNIVESSSNATTYNLQYTVSTRGSLQVILNRYIYNIQSTQNRTGLRRWRCIEYRNQRCLALITTKGNAVLNRLNPHNHPFHDKKIIQKIEKKAVFSALEDVENYQENQKGKEAMWISRITKI